MIYSVIVGAIVFVVAVAVVFNKISDMQAEIHRLTSEQLSLKKELHELSIVCYQRHSKRSDAYIDYPNKRR